ncbi:hypothetical protein BJX70DRAFT_374109 [Aspergillus crustosus]
MFDKLSPEVLRMIEHYLSDHDRLNLSMVSKSMHRRMIPFLYESITIPLDDKRLDEIDIPVRRTCFYEKTTGTFNSFAYVRELELLALWHGARYNKCNSYAEGCWGGGKSSHDVAMERLREKLEGAFGNLRRNSLRTFAWHLDCCVPNGLLGAYGHIPLYQKEIHFISLNTGGTCAAAVDLSGLAAMSDLRSIRWEGIDPSGDPESLYQTLVANSKHLQRLDLEVHRLEDASSFQSSVECGGWDVDEFTSNLNSPLKEAVDLHSVRHLSLSRISLEWAYEQMVTVFQLDRLYTLTLRSCPYTMQFIARLAFSGMRFKLLSLKLLCFEGAGGFEDIGGWVENTFSLFLAGCGDLETLVVSRHSTLAVRTELCPRLLSLKVLDEEEYVLCPPRHLYMLT